MTLSEASARISRIIQRLDSEIEVQGAKAGADLVAMVTNRIVQKGTAHDGQRFSDYSSRQYPAGLYTGKSRSAAGEAKVKKASKEKRKISYQEFRVMNGLNPAPKNFEFTGAMWRGFGVVAVVRTNAGVRVVTGGKNADAANKISGHSEHEKKSIIRPSAQELAIVQANLIRWAQSIVDHG